jgi:hypothetical protein
MALRFDGNFQGPVALIAAAQDVTLNWADLGAVQDVQGAGHIALFLDITINDSTNVRFRPVWIPIAGGVEYVAVTRTVAAGVIALTQEYMELDVDASQSIVYSWDVYGTANFVQFQVQAGALGVDPASIDVALVTTGRF